MTGVDYIDRYMASTGIVRRVVQYYQGSTRFIYLWHGKEYTARVDRHLVAGDEFYIHEMVSQRQALLCDVQMAERLERGPDPGAEVHRADPRAPKDVLAVGQVWPEVGSARNVYCRDMRLAPDGFVMVLQVDPAKQLSGMITFIGESPSCRGVPLSVRVTSACPVRVRRGARVPVGQGRPAEWLCRLCTASRLQVQRCSRERDKVSALDGM